MALIIQISYPVLIGLRSSYNTATSGALLSTRVRIAIFGTVSLVARCHSQELGALELLINVLCSPNAAMTMRDGTIFMECRPTLTVNVSVNVKNANARRIGEARSSHWPR